VKSLLVALSAASALFLNLSSIASAAAPPVAPQMADMQYLIGTWHCTASTPQGEQTEDQVFESTFGGAWLAEKEIVTGADGQPVTISLHYTGYDSKLGSFVHVGPDFDGSYELAKSKDGNLWKDANDPRSSFVHTKVSDTQRSMVEHFTDNGKPMTISMTCEKAG
jgi:hypothetical protein